MSWHALKDCSIMIGHSDTGQGGGGCTEREREREPGPGWIQVGQGGVEPLVYITQEKAYNQIRETLPL